MTEIESYLETIEPELRVLTRLFGGTGRPFPDRVYGRGRPGFPGGRGPGGQR